MKVKKIRPLSGLLLWLMLVTPAFAELTEIDWLELMPASDLALLESLPEIGHDGDEAVTLPDEIMTGRVVPEMSGVSGKIAGFIVPLKTTQDMAILEFFLVPYYGACIHVPPPPPNQIIHVTYPSGFRIDALYEPVWVSGTIEIQRVEHDIGTAAYVIQADSIELYSN